MTTTIAAMLIAGTAIAPRSTTTLVDCTASYHATNLTGITGIYNASGSLLSGSCNVDSVMYTLWYATPEGVQAYYRNTTTGSFRTRISVKFSSNAWQSYRSGSNIGALGVKVCNYAGFSGSQTGAPCDQFYDSASWPSPLDPSTSAYLYSGLGGIRASDESFSGVKPYKLLFSQLTVDSTDTTGKTGYIEWNDYGTGSFTPWDHYLLNGRTSDWLAGVWLFPKWGANGCYTQRYTYPYPIAPLP